MRDYCSKVFVGNLPENIKKTEIEDLFYKVCSACCYELRLSLHAGCLTPAVLDARSMAASGMST